MPFPLKGRMLRPALAVLALALAALACAISASADANHRPASEPLVVRTDATVVDAPCPSGVCTMQLADAHYRGTLGTGALAGAVKLTVAAAHDNGEDGLCAPIAGHLVLGAGTPDRLVIAYSGDSCQDGHGPVTNASFTSVARFAVVHGTGAYAGARGGGLMTMPEDAADHAQLTLIGDLSR